MNTLMKVRMLGGDSERGRDRGRGYREAEQPRAGYYSGENEPMRSAYEPMDARFRDRTGREHYDNGRFAPMRSEYQSGGYEPPRMGDDDEEEYRRKWTIIENRNAPMRAQGDWPAPQYRGEMNDDGMRRIYGFGGMDGGSYATYRGPDRGDEMGWRRGSAEKGHGYSEMVPPMNREMAEEWMHGLKNEDGSHGPHWSMEQVKNLMQQRGLQGDLLRVWVAMNAEYSDMVGVYRKYGMDRPEVYLDAAMARWINDKDAVEEKEAAYYTYVVKK